MRPTLLASATLLAMAAAPLAGADWIRVEPSIGATALGGNISFGDYGVAGTEVDAKDLGLDGHKATPAIEIDIAPPLLPFGFNLGGYRYSSSGDTTLGSPLNFGGATFGGDVSTDVSLRDLYGEINFQPVRFGIGGASVGLAVHQLQAHVEMSSTGQAVTMDDTAYFPTLTGRAYVSPIDAIQIEAALEICKLSLGGNSVGYVDAKAQIGWFPLPVHYLGIFAGYRYISYDLELEPSHDASFDAKLSLSGPFLGLEGRF